MRPLHPSASAAAHSPPLINGPGGLMSLDVGELAEVIAAAFVERWTAEWRIDSSRPREPKCIPRPMSERLADSMVDVRRGPGDDVNARTVRIVDAAEVAAEAVADYMERLDS